MLALALIDVAALWVNATTFGGLLIEGGSYCTHQVFNHYNGALGTGTELGGSAGLRYSPGCWTAACAACTMLGVNRLYEVLGIHRHFEVCRFLKTS